MTVKPWVPEDQARLAVITVTKDDTEGLRATLESAKAQTNRNFRHLVIDSSTTSTYLEQMVCEYGAEYHWTSPRGIYPAMQLGLNKLTDSDYCWFLNSSDTFADPNSVEHVSRQVFAEDSMETTWILGKVMLVGGKNRTIYSATDVSSDLLSKARKGRIYFPHSSTICRVSSLRAVGAFSGRLKIAEDYLIALKILTRFGPPKTVDEVLSIFSLGGITSRKTVKTGLETVRARLMVFGASQLPREAWNVIRIVCGRPLKKAYSKIAS